MRLAFDLFGIHRLWCPAIGWLAVWPWGGAPRWRISLPKCDAMCEYRKGVWFAVELGAIIRGACHVRTNMKNLAPGLFGQNRPHPQEAL